MDALAVINYQMEQAPDERTKRQWGAVKNWLNKNARSTIEWPTGVGKTRIGFNTITLLRRDNSTRKVIIVVPTLQLQKQWRAGLSEIKQSENTEVWVINSLVKQREIMCDLLIMDEILSI